MKNPTRKEVAKQQPPKKVYAMNALAGKAHRHTCSDRDCRLIYDCNCQTSGENGRCETCRGTRRPIWVASADPQECCVGNCAMVTDRDELMLYKLAGPGPWFQCKNCARCHGWPCN